jgi:hypothetical protein
VNRSSDLESNSELEKICRGTFIALQGKAEVRSVSSIGFFLGFLALLMIKAAWSGVAAHEVIL